MKIKKKKIRFHLCALALGPLICLGMVTLAITSASIYLVTAGETKDGLKNLAYALNHICMLDGEGNFELSNGMLLKGGQYFHSDFSIVDQIKGVSGVDATIFYGDTRLLTSVCNSDGSRAVGTHASSEVRKAVLEEGNDYFSSHVLVNDVPYFGYYTPLFNSDRTIVGMVFVGKTRKIVVTAVVHTVCVIFLCMLAVGSAAAVGSMVYARNLVYSLDKIKEFLRNIARGNVEETIDSHILKREDEIGEMGNFAIALKTSINELVSTDALTGLYNRRTCEIILHNVIREYDMYQVPAVVAIGDIDFFKCVNDTYGHQGGDAVLRELAKIFQRHMENKGIVARWGGEEFIFIYERTDQEKAEAYLKELIELVRSARISYHDISIQVTMTFGAAVCAKNLTLDMLTKLADDNLYYGKKHGRDQVVFSEK